MLQYHVVGANNKHPSIHQASSIAFTKTAESSKAVRLRRIWSLWWGGTKSLTDSLALCERVKNQKYNYHDMGSASFKA